jgi:hypothetical protein
MRNRNPLALLALLVALVLGGGLLAACSPAVADEDRYVATGGTVYDQVDGDYELACVDQETGFYVDDDLCEDGEDHGHYNAVFFAMPGGSSHGHGYYEHRVGTKHYPTSTMVTNAPAGRARVHLDSGRVTLYKQGKQAGTPVKYSQDAAKIKSVTQDTDTKRESKRSGGLFGGSSKSTSNKSTSTRSSGSRR